LNWFDWLASGVLAMKYQTKLTEYQIGVFGFANFRTINRISNRCDYGNAAPKYPEASSPTEDSRRGERGVGRPGP
jgi:hypothetical protein